MAVIGALVPEGTRVRVRRGTLPLDPAAIGRTGTVVETSEYRAHCYGVILDGDQETRFFAPAELEVVEAPALPPEREEAKRRRALP
ncbi:MAG TPA: hypothetical protein VF188_15010 [Longimicrobiales bacterium]